MNQSLLRTAICAFGLAVLTACSGGSGPDTSADAHSTAARASGPEPDQAELDAQWQAILLSPGTPGVDYDPRKILVEYKPGLKPGGLAPLGKGAPALAASRPNAILRENRQYEALTDAIAARYALRIDTQVYVDGLNFASFFLPEGDDGRAIIEAVNRDFSAYVEPCTYVRLCHAHYVPNDPFYVSSTPTSGHQWGHRRIGCSAAWDITNGDAGTRIAVVDTGVNLDHFELVGQVLDPETEFPGEECDVANGNNTVEDLNGHGTFIAGLIAAAADNGEEMAGAAYGCRVIPIKIANGDSAPQDKMAAGCTLAMQLGARVVNLSWGGPSQAPILLNMVNNLYNNGVLLVTAAGNDDTTANDYPGAYANTLCVGATTESDGRCYFSNYGGYVDVAAPGWHLTSLYFGDNSSYVPNGEGTSFAAPLVAAGAGLLWSAVPSLTIDEVWSFLEDTGQPTTGFVNSGNPGNPLLRLDLDAAFDQIGAALVSAPRPNDLVQSGMLNFTATVTGVPDRVELYLGGVLMQVLTSAPWNFSLDTSAVDFGVRTVELRAIKGAETNSDSLEILIDNSGGTFPILEGFDSASSAFAAIDGRGYGQALLDALIDLPASDWTLDKVDDNGAAEWFKTGAGTHQGGGAMSMQGPLGGYAEYEIDALVSKRINLPDSNPSLVYYQHFNIEDGGQGFDRGWILVSADGGQSWAPAAKKAGGSAYFTGYQAAYAKAEIDLSAFAGQSVNLAFVFESDGDGLGEDTGQPTGWWVDTVVVATNYNTDVPTIGGVTLPAGSVFGDVPGNQQINCSVQTPSKVSSVLYILDCQPLGVIDLYDPVVSVNAGPDYFGSLTLPALPKQPNQLANLRVQYFDNLNNAGPEVIVPIYIFNLAGDVNLDNMVDQADFDAFPAKVGLGSGDGGFSPFFDSDLDGTVTEADVSAVGYFWGEEI